MKKLLAAVFILMICFSMSIPTVAAGPKPKAPTQPHRVVLSPGVMPRYQKITTILGAKAKIKVGRVAAKIVGLSTSSSKNIDFHRVATTEIRKQFPGATSSQVELLAFCALTEAAKRLESMDWSSQIFAKDLSDSLHRRNQFINTLNKVMQLISDTQDALVQNMK